MKRIAILLVALFIVGGMAFAQEDGEAYSVSVSGSATTKFGVDLDENYIGFDNSTSVDLTVTLVAKYSETATGESTWTGEIKLKDIEFEFDNAATADRGIAVDYAKITNGSVYIKIYGAASDAVDFADPVEVADTQFDDAFDSDPDGQDDVDNADQAASGSLTRDQGITIGYAGGMINDIALGIISNGTYESTEADANVDGEWGVDFAVDVQLVPDLLSLAAGAFFGTVDNTIGFGLSPKVTSGPITFDVGFDAIIPDGGDLSFEADTNLDIDLDDEGDTTIGLGGYYYSEGDLDVIFEFDEAGAAGMIPGLGVALDVRILDLISDYDAGGDGEMDMWIAADLDYTSGGLKPYVKVDYLTYLDGVFGLSAGVELGSEFTGIDKTTITLDYSAEDLTEQIADTFEGGDDNLGDITIAVKVAF